MTQCEIVQTFLEKNFKKSEPIFLSEIKIPGLTDVAIRQQLKKLIKKDVVKRYDTGIYFLPEKSMFNIEPTLAIYDVIYKKYLSDSNGICGYIGGFMFANKIGITTQVPSYYEVFTNKATTDCRTVRLGNIRTIIRRPYTVVNNQNASVLPLLDLLKNIHRISEIEGTELENCIYAYMTFKNISFQDLKPFFKYYPDSIYKNMYYIGLLNDKSS